MSSPPFEQVVVEHGPVVPRVCRALVGSHDAEDSCSDTVLAALTTYPRLRVDSNIRGWLVTIAHHKAIDRLRVGQRAPIPLDSLPEASSVNTRQSNFDLWRDVAALPPKQHAAFAYHYLADLPYAQVAELSGGSAADGIAQLRIRLGREDRP